MTTQRIAHPVDNSEGTASDRSLLESALAGRVEAWHELLQRMRPVMQRRIRRVMRTRSSRGNALDCEDILQHALVVLVRRGPAFLGGWDPDRGLSVRGFFVLFAERVTLSWLRSGRLSGAPEYAAAPNALERGDMGRAVDRLESRDLLRKVWNALTTHFDDATLGLFSAITVDEEAVPDLCGKFNLTANAVYCARRRFRAIARSLARRIDGRDDEAARPGTKCEEEMAAPASSIPSSA